MSTQFEKIFNKFYFQGNSFSLCKQDYIDDFEDISGIKLPLKYKEFCLLFGPGTMNNWFRFYCPIGDDLIDEVKIICDLKINSEEYLKNQKNLYEISENKGAKTKLINKLLNNAVIFCTTLGGTEFLWDLASYRSKDKSYDIYAIGPNTTEDSIVKIGRDFEYFIKHFCLGSKKYKLFPQIYNNSGTEKYIYERIDIEKLKMELFKEQQLNKMGYFQTLGFYLDLFFQNKLSFTIFW